MSVLDWFYCNLKERQCYKLLNCANCLDVIMESEITTTIYSINNIIDSKIPEVMDIDQTKQIFPQLNIVAKQGYKQEQQWRDIRDDFTSESVFESQQPDLSEGFQSR